MLANSVPAIIKCTILANSLAGEELVIFSVDCALRDIFLQFFVVIGDVIRFAKITGYKLVAAPGGAGSVTPF